MTKTILYINLRSHPIERVEPLKKAKELGVKVVLLADKEPNIDLSLLDDLIISDTYNFEETYSKVYEYHQKNPISGVLTWSDKDVELVSYISEKLNLPSLSKDAAKKARNKYLMREAMSTVENLCPKFRRVTTFEEFKEGVNLLGYPLVFKPVGASGSKSIIQVREGDNLEYLYDQMTQYTSPEKDKVYSYYPNEYILEEFLDGPEVTVDGLVQDQEIFIAGVVDKEITPEHSLEYLAIFPSNKQASVLDEIQQATKKAVAALGLDNCAFHLECRVTSKGVRIIECAARSGGGYITSHLVSMATGHSLTEEVIKMALSEAVNFSKFAKPEKHGGMTIILPEERGTITKLSGVVEGLELEGIKTFVPAKQVGDFIDVPPNDFSSYLGVFIGESSNFKTLYNSLLKTKELIQVTLK